MAGCNKAMPRTTSGQSGVAVRPENFRAGQLRAYSQPNVISLRYNSPLSSDLRPPSGPAENFLNRGHDATRFEPEMALQLFQRRRGAECVHADYATLIKDIP